MRSACNHLPRRRKRSTAPTLNGAPSKTASSPPFRPNWAKAPGFLSNGPQACHGGGKHGGGKHGGGKHGGGKNGGGKMGGLKRRRGERAGGDCGCRARLANLGRRKLCGGVSDVLGRPRGPCRVG